MQWEVTSQSPKSQREERNLVWLKEKTVWKRMPDSEGHRLGAEMARN
jgi:hypothetical protein